MCSDGNVAAWTKRGILVHCETALNYQTASMPDVGRTQPSFFREPGLYDRRQVLPCCSPTYYLTASSYQKLSELAQRRTPAEGFST